MYVCNILLLVSCSTPDLTSSQIQASKSHYSIIPSGANGPNIAGFVHKFGILYLNEKISYTYIDSTCASLKQEFIRLANEFAVDSLELNGPDLLVFNESFEWGISLNDSLQHGELGSVSQLSYFLDTALDLTSKQKYYIQRMYDVCSMDLTRAETSDSIDVNIWGDMQDDVWLIDERVVPEYFYYIVSTSNELWKFLDEESFHQGKQVKRPTKTLPYLKADALGGLSAIARAFGATGGIPLPEDIGATALGASVGAAFGGLIGGGVGAGLGTVGGAFLGGLISGLGKGRPSPGWNPGDGFPRDATYVYIKRP